MSLRRTWHNNVSTPIPAEVDHNEIVKIVHDHGFLITLSPIVTRYEQAGKEGDRLEYDVWENIDFIPGIWRREITFHCSFENKDDGVTTWIQAPAGLTSQATYTEKKAESEAGRWVLDESIESACSVFLKAFVEKTMVSTRQQMHQSILEKARENQSKAQTKTKPRTEL